MTSAPSTAASSRRARFRAGIPISGPAMLLVSLLTGTPLLVLEGSPATWFSLLASTATAVLAAAAAGYAAARTWAHGRIGSGWALLALGAACWAGANLYAAGRDQMTHGGLHSPAPSDAGFLMFPVTATIGLWLLAGSSSRLGTRLTSLLDGLIFTGSLLAISWNAFLRQTWEGSAGTTESALTFAVWLAYPCSDLVLGTMVFVLATRTRPKARRVVALLVLALLGMGVADALFALGQAEGEYLAGARSDAGWVIGFTALAFAGWSTARAPAQLEEADVQHRWQILLPYGPFGMALAIAILQAVQGRRLDAVPTVTLMAVLAFVLIRQLVTLLHNAALTDQVRYQAFHDSLTGLANRALFTDRLEHALALRERGEHELVVAHIDLHDFTVINDTLGHEAGDTLLQGVAERLRGCFSTCDTIARLGGDEFGVIIESGTRAEVEAQKILDSMRHPFTVRNGTVAPTVSVGVAATRALPSGTPLTPEEVMKQVDLALVAARALGGNDYAVFEPIMSHNFDEEMALRRELAQAVDAGALTVVHQPIHDLATRRIVGVEALARWSDGTLGDVPPATFIPVAERAHLIAPIGEFVLDRACQQFGRWKRSGETYLSVNVSTLQLLVPTFADMVTATAQRHDLRPQQLVLEVTETALAEEADISPVLAVLRERGFRVAIDDFGTGYASLRYLQHFPADVIKIDRSYVMDIETDEEAARLLGALLQMIFTLGLTCIAEGIETEGQAVRLADLGCRYAQGFLFSKPSELGQLPESAAGIPAARSPSDQPVPPARATSPGS